MRWVRPGSIDTFPRTYPSRPLQPWVPLNGYPARRRATLYDASFLNLEAKPHSFIWTVGCACYLLPARRKERKKEGKEERKEEGKEEEEDGKEEEGRKEGRQEGLAKARREELRVGPGQAKGTEEKEGQSALVGKHGHLRRPPRGLAKLRGLGDYFERLV